MKKVMFTHLPFLVLPLLSRATLSSACISAVDQLKPIHASLVMKALESAEFSQGLSRLSSTVVQDGQAAQIVEVAKALQGKILWDIPASKEAEVNETLMKLLPKVCACRCSHFIY